jgi:probable addiction module antidote protein
MARTKTTTWELTEYLDTPAARAEYLTAAFEDGDPSLIAAALGDVARATGMARVAEQAGLGRESLYKSLTRGGSPALATVLRVMAALGLELRPVPSTAARPRSRTPLTRRAR